jgi:hypothetical protein
VSDIQGRRLHLCCAEYPDIFVMHIIQGRPGFITVQVELIKNGNHSGLGLVQTCFGSAYDRVIRIACYACKA